MLIHLLNPLQNQHYLSKDSETVALHTEPSTAPNGVILRERSEPKDPSLFLPLRKRILRLRRTKCGCAQNDMLVTLVGVRGSVSCPRLLFRGGAVSMVPNGIFPVVGNLILLNDRFLVPIRPRPLVWVWPSGMLHRFRYSMVPPSWPVATPSTAAIFPPTIT